MNSISVLFVCMGNICRSPSAQGVFEKLIVEKNLQSVVSVDSAGTHGYHIGGTPDSRSILAALNRNIDIGLQRARKVSKEDFETFDYIIAMDDDNYHDLLVLSPIEHRNKLHKMMAFSPHSKYMQVPDPYYGGEKGFELVLDLLQNASIGLLNFMEQ